MGIGRRKLNINPASHQPSCKDFTTTAVDPCPIDTVVRSFQMPVVRIPAISVVCGSHGVCSYFLRFRKDHGTFQVADKIAHQKLARKIAVHQFFRSLTRIWTSTILPVRSEERRVGKESRSRYTTNCDA